MIAVIEILRPANGLMALTGFLIGAVLSGLPLAPIPAQLLIGAIVVFFASGAGMVLNDYFDWQIDRINKPYRVIPSGRMTLNGAVNYAAALYGFSITLSFIFLTAPMTALVIFNAALSGLYAWKLKKSVLGHIAVSWLAASVFVLAALLTGGFAASAVVLFALIFCGSMAREIIKGVEDYKGDKAAGARTLAVTLGMDVASWLAIMFLVLTLSMIPLPYILTFSKNGYLLPGTAAATLLAYSAYMLFKNNAVKSQNAIKWAMVATLLGLILGMFF